MVSLTTFFHFSKKDKVEYRGVPMRIPPSKPQRPSDVVDDCQDSRKSEIPEIRGSAEIRDTGRAPPAKSEIPDACSPENPRSRRKIRDSGPPKIRDSGGPQRLHSFACEKTMSGRKQFLDAQSQGGGHRSHVARGFHTSISRCY